MKKILAVLNGKLPLQRRICDLRSLYECPSEGLNASGNAECCYFYSMTLSPLSDVVDLVYDTGIKHTKFLYEQMRPFTRVATL